jgi:hypothetical protein
MCIKKLHDFIQILLTAGSNTLKQDLAQNLRANFATFGRLKLVIPAMALDQTVK